MKYNELTMNKQKSAKRAGRGISAGRGKTAGRGTKGQGARKSGGVRPGFEGGQMPLYMRLPKNRGFKSKRLPAENVYTGELNNVRATKVDNFGLFEAGLISSPFIRVKIILKGELNAKKDITCQSISATARDSLEKAGGSFTKIDMISRPKKAKEPS